jgi:hypothetical protein
MQVTFTPAADQLLAQKPAFRQQLDQALTASTAAASCTVDVDPAVAGGLVIQSPGRPAVQVPPADVTDTNAADVAARIRTRVETARPAAAATEQRGWWSVWTWVRDNIGGIVTVVLLAAFLWWMTDALGKDGVLTRLREPDFARGLITFTISVAAIVLAFILVVNAQFGRSDEDRYRRGREVFTGLMGVLGTIVGFYFGTATQPGRELQLAPPEFPKVEGAEQVITHASGGTPPYTYSIDFGGQAEPVKNKASEKGWIREPIPDKAGKTVKVTVTDKANHQAITSGDRPGAK